MASDCRCAVAIGAILFVLACLRLTFGTLVFAAFRTSASAPLLSICNLMFGNLFKAPIGAFSSGLHSSPEVEKNLQK
jgi:hypothetical protein